MRTFECVKCRARTYMLDGVMAPPCVLPGCSGTMNPLTTEPDPVATLRHERGVIKPCPFCGSDPVFPEAKDVYGTCYDAYCPDCGVATISLQIIDCFDRPRDHVHDSWDEKEIKYADKYIEVAKQEAENLWNRRAFITLN